MNKVISLPFCIALITSVYVLLSPGTVYSQQEQNARGYQLPLALAVEAAQAAIEACEKSGYSVSVSIVDVAGNVKLQLKGDNSTIHTKDSSYGKAYTIVTMGSVFGLDTTGAFAKMLNKAQANNPSLAAIPNIPGILPLTGGVAIKAQGKIIAGIGVGGAPGGKKDEICSLAGIAQISDRLPK